MHLSFRPGLPSTLCTSSAKGVWLWTHMLLSNGTESFSDSSVARSDSCLPPPLVRRIKGIRSFCRKERHSGAPGMAAELRRRTPSMLFLMLCPAHLFLSHRNKTYSNAKAKSGIFLLSLPLDLHLTLSLKLSGRLDLTEVSVDHLKRGERNLGSRARILCLS